MDLSFFRPTVAEIDLDVMTHNVQWIKNRLSPTIELIAVVKADAYGHGAIPVVQHLQSIGVHYFAVAFLDEAIELRKAGILDPILVLGYTPNEGIETAFQYDITLTVFTDDAIHQIHQAGEEFRKKLKIHIKVDTGMGRIGVISEKLYDFYNDLKQSQWVEIEGIFTHFATADETDKTFTLEQYDQFNRAMTLIQKENSIRYTHVSNSAALIDLPELKQTMGRLGISLYGLLPSQEVRIEPDSLKPVISIRTEVVYLKEINPGDTVSYGATFKATRKTKVATLPIGYADGLSRRLSNKGQVLIHGRKAPIIGRICMDQTMIDVTDIPDVQIGNEVVIIGRQMDEYIGFDDHAAIVGTINYELATLIGRRIPRIYRKDGKITEIKNALFK